MQSLKQFLEARMIATGDFKISASGRKVRRLIKVGDDDYNRADDIDKDGDVDADDKKRKKMQGESVEVVEAKAANTQSTRTELGKRPRKELTGKDADDKKKESDDAWERLMAHAAAQGKPVKEGAELDKAKTQAAARSKSDSPGFQAYLAARRKEKEVKTVKESLEQIDDVTWYDGSDMLGEAQERYSSSYQFTHKPGDAESEKKLSDLKAATKGTGKRVVLQGRLGKNNPNAHKYSKAVWGKPGSASSGAHTHQRIKKADAAHHDVYVYDKADTQYDADTVISEAVSVKKANYSWGKMVTVHHGSDTSYPLHPEHQEAIKKLKDGEHTSFTDETNRKVSAHREGDNVHLSAKGSNKKTTVAHSHFNESFINEESEHLVHVSDGSKYDDKPHPKDVEHVMAGVKTHGGSFDGHSDKGAYFKFKSHADAKNFKKHVDSCPNRSCSADIHEGVQLEESMDKQDARLLQLARLGLLEKTDIAIFRTSMQTLKEDKQLSIKQRNLLISVYESLVSLVTGDDAIFNRTKIDLQREGYYKDIDTNKKEDERLGSWKVETPWKKVNKDVVVDKSGAKHTPLSRARHLARLAINKQGK